MKSPYNILLFFISLLVINIVGAATPKKSVGKTLLTKGKVVAIRAQGQHTLKRRSSLFVKDKISVGSGGRAQLRMVDHAVISLKEHSILRIDRYQFQNNPTRDSALMTLLAGGFRTITGIIGKANKKAYIMNTPLATIGIRGTNYGVVITQDYDYFAVWNGLIEVRSRLGGTCKVLIGRNQPYHYVRIDKKGRCTPLKKEPAVFAKGHSSNVNPVRHLVERINKVIETINHQPRIEERKFSQKVLLSNVNGRIQTGNASNVERTKIQVGNEVLSSNGRELRKELAAYSVNLGYWNNIAGSQQTSNLSWLVYEPSTAIEVGTRKGEAHYNHMLASVAGGKQGNVQVNMVVDFNQGKVNNGVIQVNSPTNQQWVGEFGGKIKSGGLNLQLNGVYVVDNSKLSKPTISSGVGSIQGDFIGKKAEAIAGAFNFKEQGNLRNRIDGVFVVEERNVK